MRAIAYCQPGDIDRDDALFDTELSTPVATGRDLLVEVKLVSVNPVDVKVRVSRKPQDGGCKTLGWDPAGIVGTVGPEVTPFRPGDQAFYAGAIKRQGANAQYHLVDERIVGGKRPRSNGPRPPRCR